MEITYEYTKQRKNFGVRPRLEDSDGSSSAAVASLAAKGGKGSSSSGTQGWMEKPPRIDPDPTQDKNWVERAVTTTELDCIPEMAVHEANTEQFIQKSRGMFHEEGGWQDSVVDARDRFLKKTLATKSFAVGVKYTATLADSYVLQNNSVDLYSHYFTSSEGSHASEPPSVKTLTVFRDPSPSKRAATKLCWHPEGPNKLAVAYSVLQFQKMAENMPVSSYIWDVNHPNKPDFEIIPHSPLCCLVYNPKSPDHLVGGSYNGLIGFWDLRKGHEPAQYSVIEKSHHDPVYDIVWTQSRTGAECCSIATDGQILWWDTRKLEAGPTDSMVLTNDSGSGNGVGSIYGGTSLEYRSDAGATRFLLGTEQGTILSLERKAKKEAQSEIKIKHVYGGESGRHHGPVYSVQRNPTNLKYFLSIGDWSAKIWMEDLKTPILSTQYDNALLTGGCWSPTRPGVFFTTKVDGTLDIWDLFYKQNDPVYTKAGDVGLSAISVQAKGKLVALGALDGSVTLYEVSDSLSVPQSAEKANMTQMFERETKREKHLEQRAIYLQRMKKDQKQKDDQRKSAAFNGASEKETSKLEADFWGAIDAASIDPKDVAAAVDAELDTTGGAGGGGAARSGSGANVLAGGNTGTADGLDGTAAVDGEAEVETDEVAATNEVEQDEKDGDTKEEDGDDDNGGAVLSASVGQSDLVDPQQQAASEQHRQIAAETETEARARAEAEVAADLLRRVDKQSATAATTKSRVADVSASSEQHAESAAGDDYAQDGFETRTEDGAAAPASGAGGN